MPYVVLTRQVAALRGAMIITVDVATCLTADAEDGASARLFNIHVATMAPMPRRRLLRLVACYWFVAIENISTF